MEMGRNLEFWLWNLFVMEIAPISLGCNFGREQEGARTMAVTFDPEQLQQYMILFWKPFDEGVT